MLIRTQCSWGREPSRTLGQRCPVYSHVEEQALRGVVYLAIHPFRSLLCLETKPQHTQHRLECLG